jgi:hypothetical protein
VAYATAHVSTPSDTIYINPGTYTETLPAMVAVGVNIKGADSATTIIKSHYVADWNQQEPSDAAISFVSSTEGTNGNQSLSGITLDGDNLTGTLGIIVKLRSNVIIHNIKIKDFYINGISYFGSSVNSESKPTTYSTGNQLYNFTITNCTDSSSTWIGGGNLNICGQKDMLVHDFVLADTSRSEGRNGDNIVNNTYGLGLKIYNGTSYKPSTANASWNFHFEIPNSAGGTEIYGITFYGGDCAVDIGGNVPIDYSYSLMYHIHDNTLIETNPSVNGSHGKTALAIEGVNVKNVLIDHNTFIKSVQPFGLTDGTGGASTFDSNIVFRNNVGTNLGSTASGSYMNLIEISKVFSGGSLIGLQFINNTLSPNSTVNSTAIKITNNGGSTMKNINLSNNIIPNGKNQYWLNVDNTGGTMDSLIIRNNILYNNPNSNAASFSGNAVTHYINSGNIFTDPLLNTDGSLQSGSPAIGAAYPYGYGSDIGGVQTTAAPTISISGDQTITATSTGVSASGIPASGQTITGYLWSKTSGPGTQVITNNTSPSATISGLQTGTYQFTCLVTQSDGQTVSATVTITVTLANIPPVANAGSDQTITLPTSSVTLSGSGTDTDGTIVSYSWSIVSGSGTITSATSATTTVTGLVAGTYVFRLTVTDNQGATGTDDMQVTVNTPNPPDALIKFRIPHKFINQ